MQDSNELREMLERHPTAVTRRTQKEVMLCRDEPAVVTDVSISTTGPSAEALMSAVTVDDLSQDLFNHLVPERYRTPDYPSRIQEVSMKRGEVVCNWRECETTEFRHGLEIQLC